MRSARSIFALAAATAVAIGAIIVVDRDSDTTDRAGEAVFPTLFEQLNSVARVRVTGSEGTFNLARSGDAWVVAEKDDYPAEPDRVHKLLVGAAGMTRVEPKTSDPERYASLWLEDPTGEDAKSVGFALENEAGTVLANWVLGNRRPSKSDASRTELYIRVAGDPQAWLAEGSVPGGGDVIDWIDRAVARIDRQRLRAVEVVHPDGAVVAVNKTLPADLDFVLRDIPPGHEVESQYRVNDIGRYLEDLRFEDVAKSSALDFAGSVDKRVEVTTFDGLRIRLETAMRDGEAWARLHAEVDEGLVETPEAAADAAPGEAGAESKETNGPLQSMDEVRAEAERLNARWKDWAYELPSFKRDYLDRSIDSLTRAIEETDETTQDGDA